MYLCRRLSPIASLLLFLPLANPQAVALGAAKVPQQSAATRLNELGPENESTAKLAGLWDVTETVWPAPNAAPIVTKGLVAERRMIGQMLQETLRSVSDPSGKVLRIDYLSFNRVEGRWEYVSMDTRAAVGMMTAQSYRREKDDHIVIYFQPFAVPGPGLEVTGQMLRMRQEIISEGPGRNQKDQYFTMADGSGTEWLAHRYTYVSKSSPSTEAVSPVPPPDASSRIAPIKRRGSLRVAVLTEYPWLKQRASESL